MSSNLLNPEQLKNIDIKAIMQILPHRYPFLLVDKILDIDLEKGTIVGQKNVTINEPFFQGHFPIVPLMPGVLILEALAQTSGVLLYLKGYQKITVLLNVNHAKFRNPVRPGDILLLESKEIHTSSKGGRVAGVAKVNEKIAAEAEIGFAFVDQNLL